MEKIKVNQIFFEGLNYKGVNVSGDVTISDGMLLWKFKDMKAFQMIFNEEKSKGVIVSPVGRKPAYVESCAGKSKEDLTKRIQDMFSQRGIKYK